MAKKILFENIGNLLTLQNAMAKKGRHVVEEDLSLISKASILVENGKISWIGSKAQMPKDLTKALSRDKKLKHVDLKGMTVLPGFVECHTHSLFAGSRAHEFEMRQNGISYQEIAKKGGGILSTMKATRAQTSTQLFESTLERVQKFAAQGVTTLEIKTGYALDEKNEIKCLKVLTELSEQKNIPQIVSTFLGAHSKPPEFQSGKEYLDFLAGLLPKIRKFTDRVDIWIEKGFFEQPEARTYLQKAKDLGFQIVIHADQLTLSGGADLAIELAALSADHVIQVGDSQIQNLAESATTAVLLPMADLYMKCAYPPARKMIDAGVRVALATDFNPGSCPSQDLSLVGLLARLEMKMTLPEVISAYTVGGAFALNQQAQIGSLELGKAANFICTNEDWTSLFYSAGDQKIHSSYLCGTAIHLNS